MNAPLNILIAEDNADDVFLLEQAFRKAGATSQLHVVGDGVEARAYLRGEEAYSDRNKHPFPEILLLDLNMPRLNGFEFLEWLHQDSQLSGLTVHVLTSSARAADVQRVYQLGANSYIIKPSRLSDLTEWIRVLHQWHRYTVFPTSPAVLATEV
jgi:CheY-like chemotaxis protein